MEGFSGLFVLLLFIAFSVLEGVGRKRKSQQKGPSGEAAARRPTDSSSSGPAPIPSRSPSRPGDSRRPGASTRGGVATAQMPAGAGRGGQGRGSEGLVPKEIWEEILGLARGEPPRPTTAEPGPSPRPPRPEAETLEEIPPFEARSLEPLEVDRDRPPPSEQGREQDRPAQSGSGYSKALTPREPSSPQRAGTLAASGGGRKLKGDLLGDGSPEDLRKAIILTEVLGPPMALRE
jgi:hypothetical protein